MTTDQEHLAAGSLRLHAMDALRAFALLLGVVLHATMSFFPGPQVWLVEDRSSSVLMSAAFFVIHMLRMMTFFLLAGYVARASYARRNAWPFLRDRLVRIGVPLVLGWPILLVALLAAAGMPASGGEGLKLSTLPLAHLWFLYLLLLIYLAASLLNPLLGRILPSGWRQHCVRLLLRPWIPLLLAAPLCLGLYMQPYWVMWFGIPTPDRGLVPGLAAALGYGTAFAYGWIVQPDPSVLRLWAARWWKHLIVAIACTAWCMAQVGAVPLLMPVPQGSQKLAFAAVYSLGAWCWALGLAGLVQRFFDSYSPVRRYLADASYWIYLVHLPLVVWFQALVAQLPLHWSIKFTAILCAALVLMLATYALFVRGTVIGQVLNGRRKPRFSSVPSNQRKGKPCVP